MCATEALAKIGQRQLKSLHVHDGVTLYAGGKAEALAGIGQGLLQPFHVNRFEAGHSPTDFPRWLTTESDELYKVQYATVSILCHVNSWSVPA